MRSNLFDLDFEELNEIIQGWNEPGYRTQQIWQGIFQKFWNNFEEFTALSLPLRKRLDQHFIIGGLNPEKDLQSNDRSTRKILYRLQDKAAIETVLMGYPDRNTVCISSQVGCGMGCNFCATGNMGFIRNLSRGEIVEQVIKTAADLGQSGKGLTNVVFMGMGEPFQNYQSVMDAVRILNNPKGFGMGTRRFTISTVGLIPGIKRFTEDNTQINLAISLHAADDVLRSSIVPINRKYPIKELLEACKRYISGETKRKVTIEYVLLDGVNDKPQHARELVKLLKDLPCKINLIPFNPFPDSGYETSSAEAIESFRNIIVKGGLLTTTRKTRGEDIDAACGQLAGKVLDKTKRNSRRQAKESISPGRAV